MRILKQWWVWIGVAAIVAYVIYRAVKTSNATKCGNTTAALAALLAGVTPGCNGAPAPQVVPQAPASASVTLCYQAVGPTCSGVFE